MASNVDSRTVLDAPGAEDLIGRGDMLYQPVDLPRPVRLQGVFVSDAEVARGHRALAGPGRRPNRSTTRGILAVGDERGRRRRRSSAGWPSWPRTSMTPRAAELVMHDRQGQHVDAADQAQARLQPGQPGHGRAGALRHRRPAGPAQPGRRRARSTGPTTGCARPTTSTVMTTERAGSRSTGPSGRRGMLTGAEADPDGDLATTRDQR